MARSKSTGAAAPKAPGVTIINLTPSQAGKKGVERRRSYGGYRPRTTYRREGAKRRTIYTPIVVQSPTRPGQGRPAVIGSKGGIYPQGKWTEKATAEKIVSALPGAAMLVTGAAVASRFLDTSPMYQGLKKKTPGGGNTLALGFGIGLGYLGYKYRTLLVLLSGLFIGAYALIKLGTKEAKLTATGEGDEDEISEDTSEAEADTSSSSSSTSSTSTSKPSPKRGPNAGGKRQPRNLPDGEIVVPSKVDKARQLFDEGAAALKAGDGDTALDKFEDALIESGDKLIYFSIAQAYEMRANKAGANATGRVHARSAIDFYKLFVQQGPNDRSDLKGQAETNIQNIRKKFFPPAPQESEGFDPVASVQGVEIGVDDDEDYIEGDDEEDYVEGDDEEDYVEGDDDADDYIEGDEVGDDRYTLVGEDANGYDDDEGIGEEVYDDGE